MNLRGMNLKGVLIVGSRKSLPPAVSSQEAKRRIICSGGFWSKDGFITNYKNLQNVSFYSRLGSAEEKEGEKQTEFKSEPLVC